MKEIKNQEKENRIINHNLKLCVNEISFNNFDDENFKDEDGDIITDFSLLDNLQIDEFIDFVLEELKHVGIFDCVNYSDFDDETTKFLYDETTKFLY